MEEMRLQRRLRREERKRPRSFVSWRSAMEDDALGREIARRCTAADIGKFALASKRAYAAAMSACLTLAKRFGVTENLREGESALDLLRFLEARDLYARPFAAFSAKHAVFLTPRGAAACGHCDDGRCGLSDQVLDANCGPERRSARPLKMRLPSSTLEQEATTTTEEKATSEVTIVGCAAGAGHSVLLSSMGVVLSCGRGAPQASTANNARKTRAATLREQQQQQLLRERGPPPPPPPPRNNNKNNHEAPPSMSDENDNAAIVDNDDDDDARVPPPVVSIRTRRRAAALMAAQTPLALRLCSARVRVVVVSASANHALFVTACGAALSSGVGAFGRLGHGNEANVTTPKRLRALENERVVSAAAGAAHSLFATARGVAFACGQGEDGRLGLGLPRSKDQDQSDDDMAMMDHHNNHDDDDYDDEGYSSTSWVVRRRRATLRRRSTTQQRPVTHFNVVRHQANGLPPGRTADRPGDVTTPRAIGVARFQTTDDDDGFVSRVAAGAYHSLFLTKAGRLYSCGHNASGQLGHSRQTTFAPELVTFPPPPPPPQQDNDDDGDDDDDDDGGGGEEDPPSSQEANNKTDYDRVVDVAAGTSHTLCCTAQGRAYSWGCNDRGALGLGDDRQFATQPSIVANLSVARVAAGGKSSAFETTDHRVFVCGQNTDGQLGLGHFDDAYSPAPRLDLLSV